MRTRLCLPDKAAAAARIAARYGIKDRLDIAAALAIKERSIFPWISLLSQPDECQEIEFAPRFNLGGAASRRRCIWNAPTAARLAGSDLVYPDLLFTAALAPKQAHAPATRARLHET